MQSWLKAEEDASRIPPLRLAAESPRGMEISTISKKLTKLKRRVTAILGAMSSLTLWW